MAATIKEIAVKARVSIATVLRALNNDSSVTYETRTQILKIAERLDYRPNILARRICPKKLNLMGLILPEISDEFFLKL